MLRFLTVAVLKFSNRARQQAEEHWAFMDGSRAGHGALTPVPQPHKILGYPRR